MVTSQRFSNLALIVIEHYSAHVSKLLVMFQNSQTISKASLASITHNAAEHGSSCAMQLSCHLHCQTCFETRFGRQPCLQCLQMYHCLHSGWWLCKASAPVDCPFSTNGLLSCRFMEATPSAVLWTLRLLATWITRIFMLYQL